MGKGAAKKAEIQSASQGEAARKSMEVSGELLEETAPARKQALGTYGAIASGKPGELQRAVAPSINAATGQFYMARRNAQNMPPGGARDQALRDINMQEASTKSSVYSGGVSDALSKLATMGGAGAQLALSGIGQAGGIYGNTAEAYAQLASSKGASAGSAAGAGGAIAAAAIAAA